MWCGKGDNKLSTIPNDLPETAAYSPPKGRGGVHWVYCGTPWSFPRKSDSPWRTDIPQSANTHYPWMSLLRPKHQRFLSHPLQIHLFAESKQKNKKSMPSGSQTRQWKSHHFKILSHYLFISFGDLPGCHIWLPEDKPSQARPQTTGFTPEENTIFVTINQH